MFYGVQTLLNAAANISKALWGQGHKFASERQDLRDRIGIDDSSPLSTVTVRNRFEHFDEKLDKWWRDPQRQGYIDLWIGPQSAIQGVAPRDRFRAFDPTTTDIYFWGQEFNIQALVTEVQRILPKLRYDASKPPWVP